MSKTFSIDVEDARIEIHCKILGRAITFVTMVALLCLHTFLPEAEPGKVSEFSTRAICAIGTSDSQAKYVQIIGHFHEGGCLPEITQSIQNRALLVGSSLTIVILRHYFWNIAQPRV